MMIMIMMMIMMIIIIIIIGGLTQYLPTDRCNRVMANTRMRNFALYKQRSPIHQPRYGHFALTSSRNSATDCTVQM